MEKIRVAELIEFRRKKTDKSKFNYANKLKKRVTIPKLPDEEASGGDYWVTSRSCIQNVFKYNSPKLYDEKIEELIRKIDGTASENVKTQFQRNVDILNNFKDFDFDELKPLEDLEYLKLNKGDTVLSINQIPVFIKPNLVFSFKKDDKVFVGGICFVTKIEIYSKDEIGMFCEMLNRYLVNAYGDKFQISEAHCMVLDTYTTKCVTSLELSSGAVPLLVDSTVSKFKEIR